MLISLATLEKGGRRTRTGRERLAEARELARRSGHAPVEMRALFHLAIGSFESGELAESLPWLTEGLDRARRAGLLSSPYPLEMRYLQLLVLYTLGRWDECLKAAASDAASLPHAGAFTMGPALYVALARGDLGAVERARALLDGPFDWMAVMVSSIALTDAGALQGDPEASVEQVRTAVAALTDDSGRRPDLTVRLAARPGRGRRRAPPLLRLSGDEAGVVRWADTATELVELARSVADAGGEARPQGPEGQAWLARAEAEWIRATTGPDAAAWEKAVAAFDYGDVYELARCQFRYAEALLAADRREEATAPARTARETAARLGAAPLLARLDTLIRRGRLGEQAPVAGDLPSPLTAREQDVLRLLALGRSNRQIGEELFITGKTASVHVSNILAKLSAASRTEAVAIAYRQGLITPEATTSG